MIKEKQNDIYKFVGDVRVLCEYGFIVNDEYAIKSTTYQYKHRDDDACFDSIYIDTEGDWKFVSWNYIYNESPIDSYIEDLINDGLVVKVGGKYGR